MIMDQTIPDIPVVTESEFAAEASQSTVASPAAEAAEAAEAAVAPAPGFDDLGLHQDVKLALDDMGYFEPTPVQRAVFEPVTSGKDLLVQSRTGTGKTTAFGLPIVNRVVPAVRQPQAMILCPTRELALQVGRELSQLGKVRGVLVEAVYGGAPIGKQIAALASGVHIIVGTPGRVLDHIGRRTLDCKTISTFVLDECDEMLSMGFLEDIERVTAQLPEKHQTLLFSATMPEEVARYARRHMKAAETLSLSRDSVSVADIHHAYYIVSGIARGRDLLKVIFAEQPESAIIFCNTRDETTTVARFLSKQGLDAEPLSSDLSQADRERVMNRMKAKNLRFLCATDVAARGIDISDLSHVINFSVPEQPEVYVHRTGRTGRAGRKGTALSLVGPRELGNFRYVRLQFGIKPEERLLPKDDIFVGRLKVPLPPLGAPQPPDPVQILIRGVPQTPSDLERQIFEKLVATANGKRVLAQLVAEKLNALSARTAPRPSRTDRSERADRPDRFESDRDARGDRNSDSEGAVDRRDRPRFGDGGRDAGMRPGFRGRFSDRSERAESSSADDNAAKDRSALEAARSWRDRPRGESMRDDRNARPRSDREQRRDRAPLERDRTSDGAADAREDRGTYGDRRESSGRRDGSRNDRGRSHPNRRDAHDTVLTSMPVSADLESAGVIEASAPDVTTETPPPEGRNGRPRRDDTVAQIASTPMAGREDETGADRDNEDRLAKRHRDDRGKSLTKDKRASEPSDATREFWETWAETKASSTPPSAPAATTLRTTEQPAQVEEPAAEEPVKPTRGRRRGETAARGRSGGAHKTDAKRTTKKAEAAATPTAKREVARGKHDTTVIATSDESQARLFINLGKKHGVSADDLRALLAGPIGGDRTRIGSVSLRDSHAHVRVPEELAETIISSISGTAHHDQPVTVERARG